MVSDLEPRITVCRVWGWTVWSSGFGLGPQHSVFTVLTYTDWVLSVDILDFSGRFGSEGKGREALQIRIPMCAGCLGRLRPPAVWPRCMRIDTGVEGKLVRIRVVVTCSGNLKGRRLQVAWHG